MNDFIISRDFQENTREFPAESPNRFHKANQKNNHLPSNTSFTSTMIPTSLPPAIPPSGIFEGWYTQFSDTHNTTIVLDFRLTKDPISNHENPKILYLEKSRGQIEGSGSDKLGKYVCQGVWNLEEYEPMQGRVVWKVFVSKIWEDQHKMQFSGKMMVHMSFDDLSSSERPNFKVHWDPEWRVSEYMKGSASFTAQNRWFIPIATNLKPSKENLFNQRNPPTTLEIPQKSHIPSSDVTQQSSEIQSPNSSTNLQPPSSDDQSIPIKPITLPQSNSSDSTESPPQPHHILISPRMDTFSDLETPVSKPLQGFKSSLNNSLNFASSMSMTLPSNQTRMIPLSKQNLMRDQLHHTSSLPDIQVLTPKSRPRLASEPIIPISFTPPITTSSGTVPSSFIPSYLPQDPDNWTKEHTVQFLTEKNCMNDALGAIFIENEIDGNEFLQLTKDELKNDLCITSLGVRKKIARFIDTLKTFRAKNSLSSNGSTTSSLQTSGSALAFQNNSSRAKSPNNFAWGTVAQAMPASNSSEEMNLPNQSSQHVFSVAPGYQNIITTSSLVEPIPVTASTGKNYFEGDLGSLSGLTVDNLSSSIKSSTPPTANRSTFSSPSSQTSPNTTTSQNPSILSNSIQMNNNLKTHDALSQKSVNSQSDTGFLARSNFEIDISDLDQWGKTLGSGFFGTVHVATYCGTKCAVKVLHKSHFRQKSQMDLFRREVEILRNLRHPNVLLFMGYCIQPQCCIVTEFLAGGSLYQHLRKFGSNLSHRPSRRLELAKGISLGMTYLHSRSPHPILHRDLTSKNILLDEHEKPRIADFGLSRPEASEVMTQAISAYPWMAPEQFRGGEYSTSCDVYSFSMILYECVRSEIPLQFAGGPERAKNPSKIAWDAAHDNWRPPLLGATYRFAVSPSSNPSQTSIKLILLRNPKLTNPSYLSKYPPQWVSQEYLDLMINCWDPNPKSRPCFKDITTYLTILSSLVEKLQVDKLLSDFVSSMNVTYPSVLSSTTVSRDIVPYHPLQVFSKFNIPISQSVIRQSSPLLLLDSEKLYQEDI